MYFLQFTHAVAKQMNRQTEKKSVKPKTWSRLGKALETDRVEVW